MKTKFVIICAICAICVQTTWAQTIQLHFPHFAGEEYNFFLIQGDKNDTIQKGNIGEDGRLKITIPKQYKGYAGMAHWILKSGGGLNFIVNGENFSVSCAEAMPNDNNIIYKDSKENDFLKKHFFTQQTLFQKLDALRMLSEAYSKEKENPLYIQAQQELTKQKATFETLTNETRQSDLYAARYRRISDFYNWLPIYQIADDMTDEEKRLDDMRRFVSEELDMAALYTSGLWNAVISQTFDLYPNKADFGSAMASALQRTRSQVVFEQLANDLITITEQFDWPEANEKIMDYLVNSGRIKQFSNARIERAFALHKARPGTLAPTLSARKNGTNPTNVLLVFHETGCGPCDIEIPILKNNYQKIKERGYEVVTISADHDPSIFKNATSDFPWNEKYCDGEGFDGDDFKKYGIIGTPTFYVIDEKGIILGRYARYEDIKELKDE